MAIDARDWVNRLFSGRRPRKDATVSPLEFAEPTGGPTDRLLAGAWVDVYIHGKQGRIAFDQDNGKLYIKYPGGKMYVYDGVSQYEATSLLAASSRGTWVWDNLRVRGTIGGAQKPFALISDPGSVSVRRDPAGETSEHDYPGWSGH